MNGSSEPSSRLARTQLKDLLDPHSFNLLPHRPEGYNIHWCVPPLTHNRFDLAVKLAYLRDRDAKDSMYSEKVYEEHLRAWSRGTFTEFDNPEKNSISRYISDFKRIYADVRDGRFDASRSVVPLAADGSIRNGAHRAAAALYRAQPIAVLHTDLAPHVFDYRYFLGLRMSKAYVSYVATRFVEFAEDSFVALLWPRERAKHDRLLQLFSRIIYHADIPLDRRGMHNLTAQVYEEAPRLGTPENIYGDAMSKFDCRFSRGYPLRVVAFQTQSEDEARALSSRARAVCRSEEHAIHVTSSHKEAVRLARMLFNQPVWTIRSAARWFRQLAEGL